MIEKFIFKVFLFFQSLCPRLPSKFGKSANIMFLKKFLRKKQRVLKNAECYADFDSVEKVAKKLMRNKLSTKCVLESHFTYISGLRGSILSNKVKISVQDY